jgi:hypothetical protein
LFWVLKITICLLQKRQIIPRMHQMKRRPSISIDKTGG